jgi:hypothetical protein
MFGIPLWALVAGLFLYAKKGSTPPAPPPALAPADTWVPLRSSTGAAITAALTTGSNVAALSALRVMPAGASLRFASQPGKTYTLKNNMNTRGGVLTQPYDGPPDTHAVVTTNGQGA